MHRLHHIVHHFNQENIHARKQRNTSAKYRLHPSYCDIKTADCCARLCQWIYNVSNPEVDQSLPIHPFCNQYDDKDWNIIKTETGKTGKNITAYSILSPKILNDTLFIVFAGTQPDEQPLQVAVDLCAVHQPLIDRSDSTKPIARVHTGIYGNMKRDFQTIHHEYLSGENLQNIKHVIVTGHSLGGGLAILFAYNTLRHKRDFDNIKLDVITFGAPMVFADIQNHELITTLSQSCHNFVNLNDPVPRLPGAREWVKDVVPAMAKKIAKESVGKWIYFPFAKGKIDDNVKTFMEKINNPKTLQLFSDYFPCGRYYFVGDGKMKISSNTDVTKKHLYFNPFDPNEYAYIDFMKVVSNHYIASYIQSLQSMHVSDDHVVALRKLDKMRQEVRKKELIDVLQELAKDTEKNFEEKHEYILQQIKQEMSKQNQNQLLQYTEILSKLVEQNKIMDKQKRSQLEMYQDIIKKLKKQNESESKNYEQIVNQFAVQKKNLTAQRNDVLKKYGELLTHLKTQNALITQQKANEVAHYQELKENQYKYYKELKNNQGAQHQELKSKLKRSDQAVASSMKRQTALIKQQAEQQRARFEELKGNERAYFEELKKNESAVIAAMEKQVATLTQQNENEGKRSAQLLHAIASQSETIRKQKDDANEQYQQLKQSQDQCANIVNEIEKEMKILKDQKGNGWAIATFFAVMVIMAMNFSRK